VLSAKPWKAEAIIRLVLSIFICQFLGSVGVSVARYPQASHPVNPWIFGGLAAGCLICSVAALFILHRPWDLDRFTRPFLMMIFCLYLGLTLGAFVQYFVGKAGDENPTLRTIIATLSFQGMALIFIWRFVREHHTRWRDAFGFQLDWKTALLCGVLLAVAFLPVAWLLQMVTIKIMVGVNLKPEVQQAVRALTHSITWFDRVALGVVAVGLAPIAEEVLFRGIIYPAVKQAGFPRLALWGTSIIFAAIHLNLATFVPLLVLALALTWIYERTGNLLAPIAAHAVFNATEFTLFYLLPVVARKIEWLQRFVVDQ
jgi:membrane protease YdiL (CAAX protease family)